MEEKLAQPTVMSPEQAMLQNQAIMQQIVREMKEIPELPSEIPTDVHALTKVEFPEQGGILTWMDGYDEPYKGFPYFEFVDKIDTLKKLGRGVLSSFFHSLKKRNKLEVALLICVPWLFNALIKAALYTAHRVIDRFKIKEQRYSDAVREVFRAFSIAIADDSPEETDFRFKVRDLLCMILENDNAYRFRFQDVIVELDREALQKNCGKEIMRLFNLMQDRETHQDVKDTWTLLKTFLPALLFFNRRLRKKLVRLLLEINVEKVRLSKEDLFYCRPRKDYKFGCIEYVN